MRDVERHFNWDRVMQDLLTHYRQLSHGSERHAHPQHG